MIFVQKLPTLEPEMRGALRNHIMRKRQRLKQEQEQDAIEKRLKREKELKKIQDAMTLDQIKEQLSTLEKRLETLRDEKHHLFVQLKQVLNENNTKRKQTNNESDQKKQNPNEEASQAPITNGNINQSQQQQTSTQNESDQNKATPAAAAATVTLTCRVQDLSSSGPQVQLPTMKVSSPQNYPPLNSSPMKPITLTHSGHTSQGVGAPILPIHSIYSSSPSTISNSRPIYSNKPLQNLDTHPQFRPQLSSAGSIPPELMNSAPLDFGQHRMQQAHLDHHRPMYMDIPLSLATNQHDMNNIISMAGKRPLNTANLSDPHLDDRSIARKKPNNYMYPNSNQFLINGLPPPHGLPPPGLSQYNPLNQPRLAAGLQSTPIGTTVPTSSVPNLMASNYHPRNKLPHQLATNFDYMMSQSKPNLIVPGLNAYYQSHSPLLPPNHQLYPGMEADLRNFTSPYPPTMAQQYGNNQPRLAINSQLQQEHQSRYFGTNMNFQQRKLPQQKNPYQPNK